jgi:Ca-activated chloride channel family protein
MVKAYRLVGFDNKREAIADETNDLEGGEIGSGNSTLAVFEIVPTEQNLNSNKVGVEEAIAHLQLNYSFLNDTTMLKIQHTVPNNYLPFESIHKDLQFATVVSMLALKLKQSSYVNGIDWLTIDLLAQKVVNKKDYLQNEFLKLLEKVQKIYPEKKNKKTKVRAS